MSGGWTRRDFVRGLAAASSAGLLASRPRPAAAESPPETTRLRLIKYPSLCMAPQYVAQELLRAEGLTDVQYVEFPGEGTRAFERLGTGDLDMLQWFIAPGVVEVDRGAPIVFLAGVHVGCFELFGTDRVRSVRDLKGKTIVVPGIQAVPHMFLLAILTYVGLDPAKDVNFVVRPSAEAKMLLAEGQVDAYLGFPPDPQELRAKKVGRIVLTSAVDRPWSQYFCCFVMANREFVRRHPVATKRAVRAILKADGICALEPERAAQTLTGLGLTKNYKYALQSMRDVPYGRWRDYNPEDTVRFYALRLHEAGMIKSTPQKIIARGSDWRFLTELKKELKG
ncbi:MAG: ABC transporter substrate-binding protein [Candidatus Rokuibacteriota bacterium]